VVELRVEQPMQFIVVVAILLLEMAAVEVDWAI
jgi:hypothetical protein